METEIALDAERQRAAREYARKRRGLSLLDMGIAAIGIAIILGAGLDRWLRDVLSTDFLGWQPLAGWYPLRILPYFLILLIGYQIITTPISYYGGFVLSHRYGLSTQSRGSWVLDLLKGFLLGLIFEAFVIELIYALLAVQPQLWWLWVALALLLFSVVLANLGPVLLYPLFYKFTPLPEGELTARLIALVERANTRVRGVFLMRLSDKTTAANAALMGLGNTRRIVLGDTMVDRYTADEIEVVLAHELGHHVHHDIWKLIISQSLLTLGGLFLFNLVLHWIVEVQHAYAALSDPATMPLLFLLTSVFGLIVMPLSNGLSRAIEYQADEYALAATGKVAAFKCAMTRLANQNLSDVEPSPLIEFLFYNHPAIGKRLRHADEFAIRTPTTGRKRQIGAIMKDEQ
jgi:STE24 endopeptidase